MQTDSPMTHDAPSAALLTAEISFLRAYATTLTGSLSSADDLVQETLLKAWKNWSSFQQGTNLRGWLVTILRNSFYSNYRKTRREVSDTDGIYTHNLVARADQDSGFQLKEFRAALDKLTPEHREVLVMIGIAEMSYEEAVEICGVPTGTIKSRLNRARAKLAEHMGIRGIEDIGPDAVNSGVLSRATSVAR
jgi:RNA polymerase sigma-70 factor (ECF subfamily)